MELTHLIEQLVLEEKKKADRCLRIARRKFDKSSAYRSGAIVRCRQGKIWKGISESATDEEIDFQLLLEELEKNGLLLLNLGI